MGEVKCLYGEKLTLPTPDGVSARGGHPPRADFLRMETVRHVLLENGLKNWHTQGSYGR